MPSHSCDALGQTPRWRRFGRLAYRILPPVFGAASSSNRGNWGYGWALLRTKRIDFAPKFPLPPDAKISMS